MKINKKQFQKWIDALYSGEYKQGQMSLQNKFGYCCLGVGCKVLIAQDKLQMENAFIAGGLPVEQEYAPKWLTEINTEFRRATGAPMTMLNDTEDFTFEEIGMLLEAVYKYKVLDK